jgi:MFS family permease
MKPPQGTLATVSQTVPITSRDLGRRADQSLFLGVGIALGGLLGYGIGHINSHLASWRWEFVIIGAACSLWAVFMWIFIPDAPHATNWLTRRQSLIVVSRKRNDHAGVDKRKLKWDQVKESATDIKTYLYFFLGFFANGECSGTRRVVERGTWG